MRTLAREADTAAKDRQVTACTPTSLDIQRIEGSGTVTYMQILRHTNAKKGTCDGLWHAQKSLVAFSANLFRCGKNHYVLIHKCYSSTDVNGEV